jgi:hypothetical protein
VPRNGYGTATVIGIIATRVIAIPDEFVVVGEPLTRAALERSIAHPAERR